MEDFQYRKDFKVLEDEYMKHFRIEPYLYSFHQDFATIFQGKMHCVNLLKPLYVVPGSRRKDQFREQLQALAMGKGKEMGIRYDQIKHGDALSHRKNEDGTWIISSKNYKCGNSKYRGVKRAKHERKLEKKRIGREGKIHHKYNPIH